MATETFLVPLGDGRWLALAPDAFRAALEAGAALVPSTLRLAGPELTQRLLSAEELERSTGVPASWFATQARERRIQFRKFGRYVRFSFEEIMACDAFKRRAIPPGQLCTGKENRKARASD